MAGITYHVPPMPPAAEHTEYFDVGPLRIGIEYRKLDPADIEAAYAGDEAQLAEVRESSPEGGFSDEGLSLHIEGSADGLEHLRFDLFADVPHYHYVDHANDTNNIVDYDPVALGEMSDWVIGALEHRLVPMLEEANASELATSITRDVRELAAKTVAQELTRIRREIEGVRAAATTGDVATSRQGEISHGA